MNWLWRLSAPLDVIFLRRVSQYHVELTQAVALDVLGLGQGIAPNDLSLIVAGGYLKRLLDNSAVKEFISLYYTDILTAFDTVSQQLQQAPMSLEKE